MTPRIPQGVQQRIEQECNVSIQDIRPLGGGAISQTAYIQTIDGHLALKWDDNTRRDMIEAEVWGNMLLADTDTVYIPYIHTWGEVEGSVYLVSEYVHQAPYIEEFQRTLGEQVAELHTHSASQFGLDWDNYIGSLPQSNTWHSRWSDFFITERLRPQVKRGYDTGYLTKTDVDQFEKMFRMIDHIFPPEQPALIHGDLWSGNVLATYEGMPALIDPAVYYGHREIELAFTRLFGGFSEWFYQGYSSVLRIPDGFEERIPVYNLYPQLVHLNLFEGMFYPTIMETVHKYI